MTDFTHRIRITDALDEAEVKVEPLALDATLARLDLHNWTGRVNAIEEIFDLDAECIHWDPADPEEWADMQDVTIAAYLIMSRCEAHADDLPILSVVSVEIVQVDAEAV